MNVCDVCRLSYDRTDAVATGQSSVYNIIGGAYPFSCNIDDLLCTYIEPPWTFSDNQIGRITAGERNDFPEKFVRKSLLLQRPQWYNNIIPTDFIPLIEAFKTIYRRIIIYFKRGLRFFRKFHRTGHGRFVVKNPSPSLESIGLCGGRHAVRSVDDGDSKYITGCRGRKQRIEKSAPLEANSLHDETRRYYNIYFVVRKPTGSSVL